MKLSKPQLSKVVQLGRFPTCKFILDLEKVIIYKMKETIIEK